MDDWARAIQDQRRSPSFLLNEFAVVALLAATPAHADRKVRVARRFLWHAHISAIQEFTPIAVRRWLADELAGGRHPKTLETELYALSSFCKFLEAYGLEKNPCFGIRLARRDARVPLWLNEEECARAIEIADEIGIGSEVRLALATGLRLGELIRLEWADIDIGRRVVLIRKTKSRKPRMVPLSAKALEALEMQRPRTGEFTYVFPARRRRGKSWRYIDKPGSARGWIARFKPIQQAIAKFRAVGERCTGRAWHLLRHTFASRLAQAGVSLYKIAEWMGHSDIRVTQIYAHLQTQFDPDIERV